MAADQAEKSLFASYEAGKTELSDLLRAQANRADAEREYHKLNVLYELGRMEIQNKAGVLLDHLGVQLAAETAGR